MTATSSTASPQDDVAPSDSLPRWQSPLTNNARDDHCTDFSASPPSSPPPFAVNTALNSKLALWNGALWRLAVDAVAHPTNEAMRDTAHPLNRALMAAAGKEIWVECDSAAPCRTGEAVVTRGCALPAKKLIHTVGPRYSAKYRTAAESALHMCYRSTLSAAVEHRLRSVAVPCLYSKRKGYPRDEATHVAARTVRRFLEHFGDDLGARRAVRGLDRGPAAVRGHSATLLPARRRGTAAQRDAVARTRARGRAWRASDRGAAHSDRAVAADDRRLQEQ
ncbi:hypothetical protein PINS_up004776 [Pythium insidiosum]|nr:hypothetical protein PINS_up004776 [Pythium insidiosum]